MAVSGANGFYYSDLYEDDKYEYRHVRVTKDVAKLIPRNRLMSEKEWRALGIQQVFRAGALRAQMPLIHFSSIEPRMDALHGKQI